MASCLFEGTNNDSQKRVSILNTPTLQRQLEDAITKMHLPQFQKIGRRHSVTNELRMAYYELRADLLITLHIALGKTHSNSAARNHPSDAPVREQIHVTSTKIKTQLNKTRLAL